jgi:hypothetical protein
MSGNSVLAYCSGEVPDSCIPGPPDGTMATLNCNDGISIVIQCILNLAQANGSTAEDIQTESLALCPETNLTLEEVQYVLAHGCSKGIFSRYYASSAIPTFMINARMSLFNYQNRIWNRLPNQPGSFWAQSVPQVNDTI